MKLIFENRYERMLCNIYLQEMQGRTKVFFHFDGENLVEQKLPEGPDCVEIKPLLSIPIQMVDYLIKAFIDEGAKQNLRTENENLLKGKLESTELHLNDMREFSRKLLDSKLAV